MKKTRIALAISSTLLATSAFATNGTNMVGLGAQSSATGGTGVAANYGSESILSNPAMIGMTSGTQMMFGGTYFKPSVKTESDLKNAASGGMSPKASGTSEADTNVIPAVSLSSRINDSLTFGIGMFGTSGMGVDYRTNDGLFNAQSNMQIMKFSPTIAYNGSKFGVGISPVLQYGSLDINYKSQVHDGQTSATDMNGKPLFLTSASNAGKPGQGATEGSVTTSPADSPTAPTSFNTPLMQQVGSGVASDLGMGYSIGGYFNLMNNLTLAIAYQSPINMNYKGQLSTAGAGFGLQFSDELEQPSEMKVGIAYSISKFMVTADYKQIGWGSAKGYKDFGWQDQNVIALGGKYTTDKFWLGIGYNKGDNPIKEQDGAAGTMAQYNAHATNMFNNIFFPATTETHFTLGGGYSLTKSVAIDLAVVMANQSETTVNTSAVSSAFAVDGGMPASNYPSSSTTKHSQIGYTLGLRYDF